MARMNCVEHARIGDGGGIAVALQLKFRGVDAARHIGGELQQQIDVVAGERRPWNKDGTGEDQRQQDLDYAHRRTASTIAGKDGENSTAERLYNTGCRVRQLGMTVN